MEEKKISILFLSIAILCSCTMPVVGQRLGDVRLAGFESTKLMGRLEFFANGNWHGICNDGFGTRELAVACRQLGLGNGVRVYNPDTDAANKTRYGNAGRKDPVIVRFGSASILLEVSCVGTENYLLNCGFSTTHDCLTTEAIAVQCSEYRPQPYSGQVRLVGGDYPSEGIVQVYFNGEWGIVCDPGFDSNAALAVCKQLGYSTGSASIGATSYGSPSGPVWVTSLSCGSSERCLSECLSTAPSSPGSCSGNGFATVACGYGRVQIVNEPRECERNSTPGEGSLRLVDLRGAPHSGANGTLQVYMNGQWGGFCGLTSNYDRESLDVICRQLGYRTWATTGASTISGGTMHITDISCTGVEDNVFGCQYGNTSMSQCGNTYLFITCNPDVFNVAMYGSVTMSGTTDGAGLLFVGGGGGFGPICDRDFDLVDGGVACRQMGYEGVYAVPKGSYYGSNGLSPAVTHITCEGSESHLLSCNHRRDSTKLCTANSLAGVHCTANASDTDRGSLRLADGNSSSGSLEISLDGRWWGVCSLVFSTAAANVACRQLGFSSGAVGYTSGRVRDSGVADIFTVVRCRGSEQRIYDCSYVTLPLTLCATGVNLTCAMPTPSTTPSPCDTSKKDMCSSLFSLRNQTLSSPGTAGRCSVSDDCTRLSCTLTVSYSRIQVPLSLTTTLYPCSVPYKVHLAVSSPLLGKIVNDHFTESRTITISVFGSNADVIVSLTEQCYGVTISNAVLIGGNRLDFISPANISMFCDRSTSITMATSPMLSIPVTTAYNPTTTTPTFTPITTPTITPLLCDASKEDMCSSLFSLRSQTVSSPSTAGSCSVSDDCTNLSCTLTVSYSGFNIPLSLTTTLHPCSVPYKVHLAVSSPLLGEIVDDDFTESRNIKIIVFDTSADVIVNITQHCYGMTISNAVLIGVSRLDFISPANIYMFCDRSSSITMETSTTPSLPMTTTLISTATTPSTMPAPSPRPTTYPACVPACVRGTCTEDRVCVCPEGWTGEVCNIRIACDPEFNVTPSVTYNAVNQTLNIVHYPPEGSACKCVFRKMEKKTPCLPRDTMRGVQMKKNEKGRLVITCKADGSSYTLSMRVQND